MELTNNEMRQLLSVLLRADEPPPSCGLDNKMTGKYVVVRCSDAGVHAGVLESYNGRECVLTEARRLWYWKPADGAAFLSGVAVNGLGDESKVGKPVSRIHLTEDCEIIECTAVAERSIRAQKNHNE
jgi:hypothetical protein